MTKSLWPKGFKLNIHAPGTGVALMLLAITQIPVAIKTSAEIACIGQISNQVWKQTKSHSTANIVAVQRCNGKG